LSTDRGFRLSRPIEDLRPHPRKGSEGLERFIRCAERVIANLKANRDIDKIQKFQDQLRIEGSEDRIKIDEDLGTKAISGNSSLWAYWDSFVLIVFLYDYYQLVGRFTFHQDLEPNPTHYIFVSIVTFIEIALNFFRAKVDCLREEKKLKYVAPNYLQGWFFFDLIANIHLELYVTRFLVVVKLFRIR
jgi:hypothetical protein